MELPKAIQELKGVTMLTETTYACVKVIVNGDCIEEKVVLTKKEHDDLLWYKEEYERIVEKLKEDRAIYYGEL